MLCRLSKYTLFSFLFNLSCCMESNSSYLYGLLNETWILPVPFNPKRTCLWFSICLVDPDRVLTTFDLIVGFWKILILIYIFIDVFVGSSCRLVEQSVSIVAYVLLHKYARLNITFIVFTTTLKCSIWALYKNFIRFKINITKYFILFKKCNTYSIAIVINRCFLKVNLFICIDNTFPWLTNKSLLEPHLFS